MIVIPLLALFLAVRQPSAAPAWVWWEGESPASTNFPKISGFEAASFPQKRGVLSGGDWLTNGGQRKGAEAFARYDVEVPAAGTYHFWCRKFYLHGPFRWQFDGGSWATCGKHVSLADSTDIRQYLCANWVYLGDVTLAAGAHAFELRLLAGEGEELTAAFDCFLLTPGAFSPRGKLKPGEASGLADPGMFAWEPPADPFTADALLDLRGLNEKVAGEHGPVRRDGDRFVLGDGAPVRFWAVDTNPDTGGLAPDQVTYFARHLAKTGVNLVRIHGQVADDTAGYPVNPQRLDHVFRLEAALKHEGIYTHLSGYFPLWFTITPGGKEDKKPFALIYFDPVFEAAYRTWLKALLTTPNPYTGMTLAKDPAVAIVELVNEDSFFFWTFSKENLTPPYWNALEGRFGAWLAGRYGTIDKAFAAWAGAKDADDDAARGRAGLVGAWDMTRDALKTADAGRRQRVSDQVRFLAGLQRGFYQRTRAWIRDELGSAALVDCSNWTVSDPAQLDALERWTYTAGEVMDQHGYFDLEHKGEGAGYSVRAGHTFKNLSALRMPEGLPIQFVQSEGWPHVISEIGWTNPNRYRTEYPFLAAVYGSVQGADGFYCFATGTPGWEAGIEKFALSCPSVLGTFPACALMYRRGDIRTADPVIRQPVDPEALLALHGTGVTAPQSFDAFRKADVPAGAKLEGAVDAIDPLSFYVGPVLRAFGAAAGTGFQRNPAGLIDRPRHRVTSGTKEAVWDWGRGLATVNTPRAQGAAGFLRAAGRTALKDVAIRCRNPYAVIVAVSLDGEPLATSKRLLLQAMTVDRPYGFRVKGGGLDGEIAELGGYPLGVERIDADVELAAARWTAVALDPNGYALPAKVRVTAEGRRTVIVHLPADAAYTILTR